MSLGPRPQIFISSVSKELRSARQLVANSLQFLGYQPVWQDIFGTQQGDLREVLKRKIDECYGVIQIIGRCYGAEPPTPDEQFGRVSYTQFEALYAESRHKKVWYQILDASFPSEQQTDESTEQQALQAAYRRHVEQGRELYHVVSSADALEANVLKLRNDLAVLRKGMRRWSRALAAAVLVLLGISTWLLFQQRSASKQLNETKGTVDAIDTTISEVNTHVHTIANAPAISSENLMALLASADIAQLTRFQSAGVTAKQFENALARKQSGAKQSVARLFFEASRGSEEATNWLKGMLKYGLDPNLLVDDEYYEQHGLIRDAILGGNAAAILVLLEAGASPHPYENLWLTPYPVPDFLFPYAYLIDSHFTLTDRRQLVEAMQRAGGVVMRFTPGVPNILGVTGQLAKAEQVIEESPQNLGVALVETPPDSQSAVSPIATRAARVTGFDWPNMVRHVPGKIVPVKSDDGRVPGESLHLYSLEIRNLINIANDNAYFLGTAQCGKPQYALIEVTKDLRKWSVYACTEEGYGICHCFANDSDSKPPRQCWKKFTMTYDPESQRVKVFDEYDYDAVPRD